MFNIDKYFIAFVLPPPIQQEVMAMKEYVKEHFNSKGALRSPAHITLHMPFEWKGSKEEDLIRVLSGFSFTAPIPIELKGFNAFEPRVVFVDLSKNDVLHMFQKQLVQHVKANLGLMNEAENRRGFHPHVTIAFRDLKKEAFYRCISHFKPMSYQAGFSATSFHLLKQCEGHWQTYKEFAFCK